MRNYNLLLLFTFMVFCWNCAENLEMDEVEQTATEALLKEGRERKEKIDGMYKN